MQVTIRRAMPGDAEAISAIWEVVCAERVYTALFSQSGGREESAAGWPPIPSNSHAPAAMKRSLSTCVQVTPGRRPFTAVWALSPRGCSSVTSRSMDNTRTSSLWNSSCEWTEGLFPIPHRPTCRPSASSPAGRSRRLPGQPGPVPVRTATPLPGPGRPHSPRTAESPPACPTVPSGGIDV